MGGKAFEDITRPIQKVEITETLSSLERALWAAGSKIPPDYLVKNMLGSAGKKAVSGDIDINMDYKKFDLLHEASVLEAVLGVDRVKSRPGFNQIFTAVPIEGTDDFVQVDFMFGDYYWQQFSYFSAQSLETASLDGLAGWSGYQRWTRYKGLYRTELIKALVAFNSSWVLEEDGEMIARVGPTFFHDRGLIWRYRHRPFKKGSTTDRVKAFKELTREEFLAIYPSANCATREVMTNPLEVVELILANDYSPALVESFESLCICLEQVYKPEDRKIIWKIFLERLNSLKVDIPKEILKLYA
jgi:hypothetical protein